MADSLLEQITPYLATGSVGLVSLYAGRRWERRGGHEAWLRSQRREVYARTLRVLNELWDPVFEIWTARTSPTPSNAGPDYEETRNARVRELVQAFTERFLPTAVDVSETRLLGPNSVADTADAYREAYRRAIGQLINDDVEPPIEDAMYHEQPFALRLAEARDAFVAAAIAVIQ